MKAETRKLLGQTAGHIRIVDVLGEGGMGAVYVGFDDTLQRKVALKAIRAEHRLSAEAKARFLREARILSQVDHPNICRVFDYIEGDENDFLVLELIQGRSLRRVIGEGLGRDRALEIVKQILGVLVAVHGQGVIHRDLKPENVMITESGEVKVLDFGLARSLHEEAAYSAVATRVQRAPERPYSDEGILTPAGDQVTREIPDSGPDQSSILDAGKTNGLTGASGASGTNDPGQGLENGSKGPEASYVKTLLGTVLGTLGYMSPEQARGEAATPASDVYSIGVILQEMLTGQAPFEAGVAPSTLLAMAAEGKTQAVSGLPADLTALIERLKALAPGIRPSSLDALAELQGILDKPRKRAKKIALAAAMSVLVLFAAVLSFLMVRVAHEAQRANREAQRANREAESAEQVSDFLVGLFEVSDPSEARGNTITAREILDKGVSKVSGELQDQPLVRARFQETVGVVYRNLGLLHDARPLLEESYATRLQLLGEHDAATATSATSLASLDLQQDRYEEAERLLLQALEGREAAFGPEHPDVARSLHNLGTVYKDTGRYEEAEVLFNRSMAIKEKTLEAGDPSLAMGYYHLAVLQRKQRLFGKAEESFRKAIAIQKQTLGPDHPRTGYAQNGLALVYSNQGRFDEAESLYLETLDLWERTLGPDHHRVGTVLANLGSLYQLQERWDEARTTLTRSLQIKENALGPQHGSLAYSLISLADVSRSLGDMVEADALYRRALEIRELALGPNHPETAFSIFSLADFCIDQERHAEARTLFLKCLRIWKETLGPDHANVGYALAGLAEVEAARGNNQLARQYYGQAIAILETSVGPDDLDLLALREAVASLPPAIIG